MLILIHSDYLLVGAALNGHLIRTDSDDLLVAATAPHDDLLNVDMFLTFLLLREYCLTYPPTPEDEHDLLTPAFHPGDSPLSFHGHFVHNHFTCRDSHTLLIWLKTLLDLFLATIVFLQAVYDIC